MEYDHVKLANSAKIPCTMRTLKPFSTNDLAPWIHYGECSQAILYLAGRIEFEEIRALKELLESLSSSLKNLSVIKEVPQDETEDTGGL